MPSWDVYLTPEMLMQDRLDREQAFGEPASKAQRLLIGRPPGQRLIEADELTVEGGALVFLSDGRITEVVGPSVYAFCTLRRDE